MTHTNKPPMFGPSGEFDPATYEPRPGKSFWAASTDLSALACNADQASAFIGNCTTRILLKSESDPQHNDRHPAFTRDVLLAICSLKAKAQATGITLHDLSVQMGMQSTLQGNKRLLDSLERLMAQQAMPGLDFSRTDGILRIPSDA